VSREQASLIASLPQIARGPDGRARVSREVLVLNSLIKRETGTRSNVPIRGVSAQGPSLRPQVKLTAGRMFRQGSTEIVVGASVARQFVGVEIGRTLTFAQRQWLVVGLFDAGNTAFDSEIWGDAEQMMQAFRRLNFSSVLAQLAAPGEFDALERAVAAEPRFTTDLRTERRFYEDQSKALSTFITFLGIFLSVIFSLGAIIGASITMYASVATRTAEIGTLRALGFRRRTILAAFLQTITVSTTNFSSFSELAFSFSLTPSIVFDSLLFALVMGFVGGFLPAIKASRMQIVDALRAG
jgi:putative ABC transport system permease protein